MEIVVRDVTIRGEKLYIVDIGLPKERQLNLLLEAAYNSILTDPEFVEQSKKNKETERKLKSLRGCIENFLKSQEVTVYRKTG